MQIHRWNILPLTSRPRDVCDKSPSLSNLYVAPQDDQCTDQCAASGICLDRRIREIGDELSHMLATGQIAGAPREAIQKLQELPLDILDVAAEVTVLMRSKRTAGFATVFALSVAIAALMFAGVQTMGLGEPKLGAAELVAAMGLACWASLTRG